MYLCGEIFASNNFSLTTSLFSCAQKKDGDPSKPPSKKLKKDGKAGGAGKAGKQGAKAVASNVTRVPSVIPLPRLCVLFRYLETL
jgi:hypothetical protein